jgi:hypothetical protein
MSVFLDWVIELVRLLTGSLPVSSTQKNNSLKDNININVNISYPHKEVREKKEKDIVGTIKIFAGSHPPIGWLPCDGRTVKIRETHLEEMERRLFVYQISEGESSLVLERDRI